MAELKADVLVLGAGMVGVSAALHLQQRGRDVILVDRHELAGEETSFGNAGLIECASVFPYMFPRDLAELIRYAFNRSPQAHYRLADLPHFLPWLVRYFLASSPQRALHSAMAELPCVLVDAQRAGPSTGMPTRHEQGDLLMAATGGHGDIQRIVLAPTSVEDCFYQVQNAFNLADQYQMPVIVLQDTVLAVRNESIQRPDPNRIPRRAQGCDSNDRAAEQASYALRRSAEQRSAPRQRAEK